MHAPIALPVFEHAQVLPGGFRFPARMTVIPLRDGTLALVSPIPIDDARAAELATLGEVRFLIAPNLLHHLYLGPAAQRYPQALLIAPAGLRRKRPDLTIHSTFDEALPAPLRAAVDVIPIKGAPSMEEHVLFHAASRTLVVTDLVFNIEQPQGWLAHAALFCVGCHGRLAQSRAWRFFVKDRAAAAASVEQVLGLPFETLVMAHGQVESAHARQKLAAALAWLRPRAALQESGSPR